MPSCYSALDRHVQDRCASTQKGTPEPLPASAPTTTTPTSRADADLAQQTAPEKLTDSRPVQVIDPTTAVFPETRFHAVHHPRPPRSATILTDGGLALGQNYQAPILSEVRQQLPVAPDAEREPAPKISRTAPIHEPATDRRRCSASPTRPRVVGTDVTVNWNHRFSRSSRCAALSVHTRPATSVHFANTTNGLGTPASQATTRSPSTGVPRRWRSPAWRDSPTRCLVTTTPSPTPEASRATCFEAVTTSRSAVTSATTRSTSCLSRIRGGRSHSPARPAATTSPTSCSGHRRQLDRIRQRRQVLPWLLVRRLHHR